MLKVKNDIGNKETRLFILYKFDFKCAYCGCDLDMETLTIDHIEPCRRSPNSENKGESKVHNYNPACSPCNISKASYSLEEWRKKISEKIIRLEKESSLFRLLKRFGMVTYHNRRVEFYFEKINNG